MNYVQFYTFLLLSRLWNYHRLKLDLQLYRRSSFTGNNPKHDLVPLFCFVLLLFWSLDFAETNIRLTNQSIMQPAYTVIQPLHLQLQQRPLHWPGDLCLMSYSSLSSCFLSLFTVSLKKAKACYLRGSDTGSEILSISLTLQQLPRCKTAGWEEDDGKRDCVCSKNEASISGTSTSSHTDVTKEILVSSEASTSIALDS